MKYPAVDYNEYLKLDKIIQAQDLRSASFGPAAHDEHLFIVVHQAYELWFKQILFEVSSVLAVMSKPSISEDSMGTVVHRLERVCAIQKLINGQIDVLETMTPLDFLDFRDFLYPASGFQSYQWRCIETRLGLKMEQRLGFNDSPFFKALTPDQQVEIQKVLNEPSLFDCIDQWLSRTPFVESSNFSFWSTYKKSVLDLLKGDLDIVMNNPRLSEGEKARSRQSLESTIQTAENFFDASSYEKLKDEGQSRLSYKAVHAALFVQIYRDRPALQTPFRLISALIDIDEKMTEWRHKHTLMVQRMIGRKIGTGGSSGADYLRATTEKHVIFKDLLTLSSFLIPRSKVPPLPKEIESMMTFRFC